MHYLINFVPMLIFILLFVGCGVYFSIIGVENAFYQFSPITAIFIVTIIGFTIHRGTIKERVNDFLDGFRHRDIITMCIVFMLAGAFSSITRSIGSVDSTVNFALSIVSPKLLLIGIFLISAFVATSIGSSMGTIATLAPIATELSLQGSFPAILGAATVVGGSMFGDNLSIVSDTTTAAVNSQKANIQEKLKLNGKVALVSAIFTMVILFLINDNSITVETRDYSLILITPYLLLIALAFSGFNVFVTLVSAIFFASIIGMINGGYNILSFNNDLTKGFYSMKEIMLLSLMIGGVSGLAGDAPKQLAYNLSEWTLKQSSQKFAQIIIIKIVALFNILLANNTIAIIFSGEIAREIAKKHKIPMHYSAAWLDIFSCVIQGIIPYGAQILLVSSIFGIAPLSISLNVYYCYILGAVTIMHILFIKVKL